VLDDGRERHGEWLGQCTDRRGSGAQPLDHGAAGGIGEGLEGL
jgi:hypothetical protein